MNNAYINCAPIRSLILCMTALFCFPMGIYIAHHRGLINFGLSICMVTALFGLFTINLIDHEKKFIEVWLAFGGLSLIYSVGLNKPKRINWFYRSANKTLLLLVQILLFFSMFLYFWIFLPFGLSLILQILSDFRSTTLESKFLGNQTNIEQHLYYLFAVIWFASVIYSYFNLFWRKGALYEIK